MSPVIAALLDDPALPDTPADAGTALAAGTPVLTLAGVLPVQFLAPGDRIVTRDGAQRLLTVQARPARARLIRVSASALGVERPEEDLLIAPDTPILVRDWRARALTGAAQALVPAHRLVDGAYIRWEAASGQPLVSLGFDAPAVIYAGGLELAVLPATIPA